MSNYLSSLGLSTNVTNRAILVLKLKWSVNGLPRAELLWLLTLWCVNWTIAETIKWTMRCRPYYGLTICQSVSLPILYILFINLFQFQVLIIQLIILLCCCRMNVFIYSLLLSLSVQRTRRERQRIILFCKTFGVFSVKDAKVQWSLFSTYSLSYFGKQSTSLLCPILTCDFGEYLLFLVQFYIKYFIFYPFSIIFPAKRFFLACT